MITIDENKYCNCSALLESSMDIEHICRFCDGTAQSKHGGMCLACGGSGAEYEEVYVCDYCDSIYPV